MLCEKAEFGVNLGACSVREIQDGCLYEASVMGAESWKFGVACTAPLTSDHHRCVFSSRPAVTECLRILGVNRMFDWEFAFIRPVHAMNTQIEHAGGACVGYINASYPFATLTADKETLQISCFGRNYTFPRNSIRKMSRHRGIFSLGLRIEHTAQSLPENVIFWVSFAFRRSPFEKLRTELEGLGYKIVV